MLRLGITIPIVIVLAVGPWLCCCATAPIAGEIQTADVDAHKCPNCRHESPPHQNEPARPNSCPCKDHATMANPTTEAGVLNSLAAIEPVAVPSAPFAVLGLARRPFHIASRGAPSLSTAELLFTHHNLRC